MQDPFSPDFIDTPIAPEPPSPAPQPTSAQPAPSFPHRPARSMAVAMLAAGLVAGSVGGGAIGAALASQHKTAATTASTVGAGVAAPAPVPGSFAAIYHTDFDVFDPKLVPNLGIDLRVEALSVARADAALVLPVSFGAIADWVSAALSADDFQHQARLTLEA